MLSDAQQFCEHQFDLSSMLEIDLSADRFPEQLRSGLVTAYEECHETFVGLDKNVMLRSLWKCLVSS